jgi:hypothetical protein
MSAVHRTSCSNILAVMAPISAATENQGTLHDSPKLASASTLPKRTPAAMMRSIFA